MAVWASRLALVVGFLAVSFMAIVRWLETEYVGDENISYVGKGWFRESADWDPEQNRVIVSCFEGGIAEVRVNCSNPGIILTEKKVIEDSDYAGNASLGVVVDSPRNRLLVAIADPNKRYSGVAAYDLHSLQRLFLTTLCGPERKSFADDVAVDKEGNAYVTDAYGNVIWKVSTDGSQTTVITSPEFSSVPSQLPGDLIGVNGIQVHPEGFLLISHTFAGVIFKASLDGSSVRVVRLEDSLMVPDGILLVSPQRLVITSALSSYLVESVDGWETARVIDTFTGPLHRLSTAAFLRSGKVYINFGIGYGFKTRLFTIREAFKNF
ncbi:hypothetical protein R1sor_017118 [Riccia sorocarpa]|uniref:SMP-30/Gluconolactonase/LRE-like region domain-containing protein n=1 Tax=Riccia sorocarpa TaxID=122646 RepID=A0ABD3I6D3_9MARC